MERECQFNRAIVCDSDECYHCGWDPEVAKARSAAGCEKLYKVPFTGFCEVWARSPEEAAEKAEDIEKQFFAHYDYGDPTRVTKEDEDEDELD
jgi:hypothetical protein